MQVTSLAYTTHEVYN